MAKGKIDIKKKGTSLDSETQNRINILAKSSELTNFVFIVLLITAVFSLGAIWNDYLAMKQATYLDLRDEVAAQNLLIQQLTEKIGDALEIQFPDMPNK